MSRRLLLTYAVSLCLASALAGQTYYVNNLNGSHNGSGTSPGTALYTIQGAIDLAPSGSIISVFNNPGFPYLDTITVTGKTLTFQSTNGRPELSYLRINLEGLADNRVTFTGGFVVSELDLIDGAIDGADSLRIVAGGKIIRRSPTAILGKQATLTGKVDVEYKGSQSMASGFELPSVESNALRYLRIAFDQSSTIPSLSLLQSIKPDTLYFEHGIIATGQYIVFLQQGASTFFQGFDRNGVVGQNKSHVFGNVQKAIQMTRNDFPVGSATHYRPVSLTFAVNPGVIMTVSHNDVAPTGVVGLPITTQGITLARYAPFYWNIKPSVSIDITQEFQLSLTAEGFTDYDAIGNVRIIRRLGEITDVGNPWVLLGTDYSYPFTGGAPTVMSVKSFGGLRSEGVNFTFGLKQSTTAVQTTSSDIPNAFFLSPNYPNPFNPSTMIEFGLPEREFVSLKIYDVLGNEIETLVDGQLTSGTYRVNWNAAARAAGVYFYRLQAGAFVETRKLVLLK